jgi:hypothetical protein
MIWRRRNAMSDKVKLPKKVALAIESLRSADFKITNWDIVYAFANSQADEYPALIEFARQDFDTFIKALVNGYQIEETPEDKVKEIHNKYIAMGHEKCRNYETNNNVPAANYYYAKADAIRDVLNILGIKIEGVND